MKKNPNKPEGQGPGQAAGKQKARVKGKKVHPGFLGAWDPPRLCRGKGDRAETRE